MFISDREEELAERRVKYACVGECTGDVLVPTYETKSMILVITSAMNLFLAVFAIYAITREQKMSQCFLLSSFAVA